MTWKQLPLKVRVLIILVTAAALPIASWAIRDLLFSPHDPDWIILLVLTLVTVPAFLVLPSSTIIGIGDTFIMAVAMLYGTSPCIITTLLHTVAATLFVPGRPKVYFYKVVFNSASMICGALLYSWVYHTLNPADPRYPEISTDPRLMLLPAAALAITFFLFNSVVTSTAIAWSMREKPSQFWVKNCIPLAHDFSVSAAAAVVIVGSQHYWRWAPLCAAPVVGLIWTWNKTNRAKAIEAVNHLRELEHLYLRTVETLALAVDAKDQTTYGHIRRVRAYALGLARLGEITDQNELRAIETGSLLHDIGKLAIEDYILNKPGRLSKHEFEKMKLHATAGDEILQQVQFPFPVAKYVRYHHERWDGKGYPDGLKGEEIPIGARILSIADAFDAIRSSRPYKSSFGLSDSIELLRMQAGSSYDPRLVELFIQHIDDLEASANEAGKNISELSFRKYFEKVNSAISKTDSAMAEQMLPSEASESLVRLFEFCSGVGRSLELSDSLPILARRLKQIVPYNTCVFYVYQQDNDLIKTEYVCGEFVQSLEGVSISLGKGISGWVAAYKHPMINTGPSLEFAGMGEELASLKDALVVPLVSDGECLGTISLYAREKLFYSQTHLSLLQTVSEQVVPLMREASTSRKPEGAGLMDPVTGTHRFAYLSVAGQQVLAHAEKIAAPLSLLYIEVRNFLQNVVLFGAGTGDLILRRVAETLKAELRQTDVLVRFGHHGFVALLAGVGGPQANRYLQRLLQLIKATPISLAPGNTSFANCQAAVASYPNDGSTLLALLQAAQKSLADQTRLATPQAAGPEGNVLEFPPRI